MFGVLYSYHFGRLFHLLLTGSIFLDIYRGGSRGGSLGSNEPPFPRIIRLTIPLFLPPVLVTQQIFSEQFTLTCMQWKFFSKGGAYV